MAIVNFYVLSTQRSGSTVLIRTLDKHSSVFCAGEVFFPGKNTHHPEWQYPFRGQRIIKNRLLLNLINISLAPARIARHIHRFYGNAGPHDKVAVGFKLMLGQYKLAPKTFKKHLSKKKCIILVRQNLLHLAVSKIKAKTTKIYHLPDNGKASENKQINIPPQYLEKMMLKLSRQNKEVEKFKGDNILHIEYGELFDWEKLSHKIAAFLEIEDLKLSPVLNKVNTRTMAESIDNYEDLRKYFSTSEFSVFFE